MREEQNADPDSMFSYSGELPPLSVIKNFMHFYVSTTKEKIYDKPTVDTVHTNVLDVVVVSPPGISI